MSTPRLRIAAVMALSVVALASQADAQARRYGNGGYNAGRLPSNYGTPVVGGQLVPGYGVINNGGTVGPINSANAYNFRNGTGYGYGYTNPYYGTSLYSGGYPNFGGISGSYGYGYGNYNYNPTLVNTGAGVGVVSYSAYPLNTGLYSSGYGFYPGGGGYGYPYGNAFGGYGGYGGFGGYGYGGFGGYGFGGVSTGVFPGGATPVRGGMLIPGYGVVNR